MPGVLVDLAPLKESKPFRKLWIGYVVNQVGSQLTIVAIAFQVFTITRSSLEVGLVSLGQVVPGIAAPLIAGAVADAFDRRKLLLVTNCGGLACSLGLAVLANVGLHSVWPLFVLAAGSAAFTGADNPIRTALMVGLIDRRLLTRANVLRTLLQQIATVVGPTAAGLFLQYGLGVVYWVDAGSFLVALWAVATLGGVDTNTHTTRFGLRSVLEGFQYAWTRQAILGCFVADLSANILGMPESLFPAMGLNHFHGDSRTVGLLFAAPGIGALAMATFSGWARKLRHFGRAVLLAVVGWAACLILFALSPYLWLALAMLVLAGAANAVSGVFRNTIVQASSPERLRGRLASIQTAVVQAGPRIGNGEAGAAAALVGTELAIVTGAIGAIVTMAAVAITMPGFRRYDPADDIDVTPSGEPDPANC
jgi:MFS family permease